MKILFIESYKNIDIKGFWNKSKYKIFKPDLKRNRKVLQFSKR